MIHPRSFFQQVKLVEPHMPVVMDSSKQQKLLDMHPSTMVSTLSIELPIFQVTYSYDTPRNNEKKAKAYIITKEIHEDTWVEVECRVLDEVRKINSKYPHKKRSNVKILDTKLFGYSRIEIG